jgi:WD40 repeat protein
MNEYYNAFISYGRADSKSFATKLYQKLTEYGLKVWFDKNDIPLGVDFQDQINDGIIKADNFLFIIAPHSINSPYCLKEIEQAVQYNKRIIPLLHVEKMTEEIWQQRNPQATLKDWEIYQKQGKHSSFPNMHPEISRINWVPFRENMDDFDRSFAGLIKLLNCYPDYVKQHTNLLVKALEWEENQKQTRYLLTGQERQTAEQWLNIKFTEEQFPCLPTDLHCEFICESHKNANNLMTQVFLAFSEKDKAKMETIRKSLMRAGITVWTSHSDIKTGQYFQQEINQGIAGADHLIYLLSPEAIKSKYCQQEIDYALSLNKRIISVLISPTDLTEVPAEIRSLQFIDMTFDSEEDALDKLIKELQEDAVYYQQHKVLLVKALKWQQQNRNPSILLRGYNLEQYQNWLELARGRTLNSPTDLQIEFISASAQHPPHLALDVFVSYSRTDADFARQLNDGLQTQGKTTWFDQESIATGSDFQQEIYRGIEQSDNFLFIISPESVNSPYCADEVEYAQHLNKRFVTVLHRNVNTGELHPELAQVQWLDFYQYGGDFYANFSELVRTLDTDREYVREHTQQSQKALEWKRENQTIDLLLRGSEYAKAYEWLMEAQTENKQPAISQEVKEFILESKAEAERLQKIEIERQQREIKQTRRIAIGSTVAAILLTGLTFFAGVTVRKSEIDQLHASRITSEMLLSSNQDLEALTEIVKVGKKLESSIWQALWPQANLRTQVTETLQRVIYQVKERNRLSGHLERVFEVSFSPNGKLLVTTEFESDTVRFWDLEGKQITTFQADQGLITSASFSPNGKFVATVDENGITSLWNLESKERIRLEGSIRKVIFSLDSKQLATIKTDNSVVLWDIDGNQSAILEHNDNVSSVIFSPVGQRFATLESTGRIHLWNLEGKSLTQFKVDEYELSDSQVAFSPDGQFLAVAENYVKGGNPRVTLRDLQGNQVTEFKGHTSSVYHLTFSPDGKLLATASHDQTARLWDLQGNEVAEFAGHQHSVRRVVFSPNAKQIATASWDGTARLWDLQGNQIAEFAGHQGIIDDVSFSPDGKLLATSGDDRTARLWDLAGQQVAQFHQHLYGVEVDFSPNGELLAVAGHEISSRNQTVSLWDWSGQKREEFINHGPSGAVSLYDVAFSPSGELIATAEEEGIARLWNLEGKQLINFKADDSRLLQIGFSPDSQLLATAGIEGIPRLWDLKGNQITEFKADIRLMRFSFSPDGQQLATAGEDGSVYLWHIEGNLKTNFQAHQGMIWDISFSPDGQHLATAGEDRMARLWNLNGNPLAEFKGHQDSILDLSFSPNGEYLATAGESSARLWNLRGKQIAEFSNEPADFYQADMNGVSFSPVGDRLPSGIGQQLITVAGDGTIKKWKIEGFDALMVRGCDWLSDYLKNNVDVEESDRYLCDGL